jgi:hypothetical protein
MGDSLSERARILAGRLAGSAEDASDVLRERQVASFCQIPVERTLLWLLTTMAAIVAAVALVPSGVFGVSTLQNAAAPPPTVQPVADARWGTDYRGHPITDWALFDENHVVVTTRGGGVHHGRLDGSPHGFWATFTRASTEGELAEDDIQQVVDDGRRFWFVGEQHSLSSCSRRFDDWQLHFGGGSFVPGLDLLRDLTCLAMSENEEWIAVGAREHGIGLYDVVSRQWKTFEAGAGARATAVLFRNQGSERTLWIGTEPARATDESLRVFTLQRQGTVLRVLPERRWALPEPFRGRPVRALHAVQSAGPERVLCVIGNGACLEADIQRETWNVLVDEGDESLRSVSGPLSLPGMVPVPGGVWLALPDQGIAFYDAACRRLTLQKDGPTGSPQALMASDPARPGESLWALVKRGASQDLYRLRDGKWQAVSPPGDWVAEAVFTGGQVVARLRDGTVRLYAEDPRPDAATSTLFRPAPPNAAFGPSEAGLGQFFAGIRVRGKPREVLARYLPGERSWQAVQADSAEPFRQLRLAGGALWGVKVNGEAGLFTPLDRKDPPVYHPVFGPSAMAGRTGTIVTAANHGSEFWMVRQEKGRGFRTYAYDPKSRATRLAIRNAERGAVPRQMRAAGNSLYLRAEEAGRGVVYEAEPDQWTPLAAAADVVQIVGLPAGLACRGASGEVSLHPVGRPPETILAGSAPARWRRLAADRFGRLWGVTHSGTSFYYECGRGTWNRLTVPAATDVVVRPAGASTDAVHFATESGLYTWQAAPGGARPEKEDFAGSTIEQIDAHESRVAVLARLGSTRTVWTQDRPGVKWRLAWQADAAGPGRAEWRQAIWAGFVKDELWWITEKSLFWKYHLRTRKWAMHPLSTGRAMDVQVEPGRLWCLDRDRTLHALDTMKGDHTEFDGRPNYVTPAKGLSEAARHTGWLLLQIAGILAIVSLAAACILWVLERYEFWCLSRGVPARTGVSPVPWAPCARAAARWIGGAALLAVVAFGAALHWQRQTEEAAAFAGTRFAGRVLGFRIERGGLSVRTEEGTWDFRRRGVELTPLRFRKGSQPLAAVNRQRLPATQGAWKLDGRPGQYTLEYATEDGGWLRPQLGTAGFWEDDVRAIAVHDDRLLAVTPAGLAEFEIGEWLQLDRFTPQGASGALTRRPDGIYCRLSSGLSYRYEPERRSWVEARPEWSSPASAHGIRWQTTPEGDELVQPEFNAAAGRFQKDMCMRLAEDTGRRLWLKTWAGWRHCSLEGTGAPLAEPVAAPPAEVPVTLILAATSTWDCRRTPAADGRDRLAFAFKPAPNRPVVADPFGVRGRWPDEDIRVVQPEETRVWLGTPAGLRCRESSAGETLILPGHAISGIALRGSDLYCRTEDGVHARSGGWQVSGTAPETLFPAARTVRLRMGPGLVVDATESSAGGQVVTAIRRFDRASGRLQEDTLEELISETDGFWVRTRAGVQRLRLAGAEVREQHGLLGERRLAGLRRGEGNSLWAGDSRSAWRLQAGSAKHPADPFRTPLRGDVTPVLRWERRFRVGGDEYVLRAGDTILQLSRGKLSCDDVRDVIGLEDRTWQATPGGIVQSRRDAGGPILEAALSWPGRAGYPVPPRDPSPLRLALDPASHALVCRTRDAGVYSYEATTQAWKSVESSAFRLLQLSYDGKRWTSTWAEIEQPQMFFDFIYKEQDRHGVRSTRPGKRRSDEARLNDAGQFPFDTIYSAALRDGEIWMTHGTGVAVTREVRRNQQVISVRYLPPSTSRPWLAGEWIPRLMAGEDGSTWMKLEDRDGSLSGGGYRVCEPGPGQIFHKVAGDDKRNPFLQQPHCELTVAGARMTLSLTPDRRAIRIEGPPAGPRLQALDHDALDVGAAGGAFWLLTPRGIASVHPERVLSGG